MRLIIIMLLPAMLAAGCEDPFFKPNVRSIERSIGVTIPVAYVATLAMSAFEGNQTDCVSFSTNCEDPPCGGMVSIVVNDSCPFPLAGDAQGVVTVTGVRVNEDTGMFAAVFTEVDVSGRKLMLQSIDAFVVTRFSAQLFGQAQPEEGLKVIFYDGDIEYTDPNVIAVEQSMWMVDVATSGTPGDPRDDVMNINGMRQAAGAGGDIPNASVSQTVLAQVKMDATCPRNPVSGFGIIEAGDIGDPMNNGITMLGFHRRCDGKALVLLSVGLAAPSTSTDVELNLLD
ncbi:MAG: hypothetical protein JRF33_01950 [Deltaproteobacteria bacterium]|nr:hypothetical protein [Deltaproteobacteria bacterium]